MQQEGDRAVVDQADDHVGAEAPGFNRGGRVPGAAGGQPPLEPEAGVVGRGRRG